jgi:hypothetical protein
MSIFFENKKIRSKFPQLSLKQVKNSLVPQNKSVRIKRYNKNLGKRWAFQIDVLN